MRAIGIGMLALALAGCSNAAYQLPTVAGGGKGLPEVTMRASRDVVVPPGRGQTKALALRTFVPAGEGWSEVTGSRCHVRGGEYFGATVVTPVRLLLPDLGPDAPVLAADCESGTLRGTAAVAPGYPWPEAGRPSAPTRAWWGAGWWWGYEKTGYLGYGDLAVALR